jgi:hypothetical protein
MSRRWSFLPTADFEIATKASMESRATNILCFGRPRAFADAREEISIFAVEFKAVSLSSLDAFVRDASEVSVLKTVLLSGFSVFMTVSSEVISVVRAAILACCCASVREQRSPL